MIRDDRTNGPTSPSESRGRCLALTRTCLPVDRILRAARGEDVGAGVASAVVPLSLRAQDDLLGRRGTDRGRTGPDAQSGADLSRTDLPSLEDLEILNSRPKTSYAVRRRLPPGLPGAGDSVLARTQHARQDLRRHVAQLDRGLRSGDLHRVHGAAGAGPHGAGRQDLPQGADGLPTRYRRRDRPAGLSCTIRRRTPSASSCRRWMSPATR